jgi:hypothetical protein
LIFESLVAGKLLFSAAVFRFRRVLAGGRVSENDEITSNFYFYLMLT